jgi:2-dehydropantoate 2-reductase
LQNGIDSSERIAQAVGPGAVLGGAAYVVASIASPGVIAHKAANKIIFGEIAGGTSPRGEQLRGLLERAGIGAELHPEVRVPVWEKFVLLAATGGVMALTRLPIGPIRNCPETTALFRGAMEEAATVGRALGVALSEDCVDRLWAQVPGLDPSVRSSMLHDLLAGRRLELESLNGTVVRLGRERGVPTPLEYCHLRGAQAVRAGGTPCCGEGPPKQADLTDHCTGCESSP